MLRQICEGGIFMKKFRILICMLLCLTVSTQIVFAKDLNQSHKITEEEVLQEIENGSAKVTNEVRDISSFTSSEIMEDQGLRELLDEISKPVPYATHTENMTGSIYSTTVETSSGDIIKYYSTPIIYIKVADLDRGGSGNFTSTFRPEVRTTVNGQSEDWGGYIVYKDMKVELGCGENTVFTDIVKVDGQSEKEGIVKALFGFATSLYGLGTVSDIFSLFDEITYSGNSVSSMHLVKDDIRAVGAKVNAVVADAGQYAVVGCDVSTEENLGTVINTNSAARWTFDVYFGKGALRPQETKTLKVDVNYEVNTK